MRRGLAPTAEMARLDIEAGRVLVGGSTADKPGRQVSPGEALVVQGPPARFVGRGGEKLEGALATFGIEVAGRRAIDAGASTGGFTDCLLQRGAAAVVAVDVGYGQLHERLREDPRVTVVDRTNVRALDPEPLGGAAEIVVADLSFISLRTVAPSLVRLSRPGADIVALVKPQFEASRTEASRRKGVISDPTVWTRVLHEVNAAFAALGATMMGVMVSPITGSDGNVEFLAHLRVADPQGSSPTGAGPAAGDERRDPADVAAAIDRAVATAVERRDEPR